MPRGRGEVPLRLSGARRKARLGERLFLVGENGVGQTCEFDIQPAWRFAMCIGEIHSDAAGNAACKSATSARSASISVSDSRLLVAPSSCGHLPPRRALP